MDRIAGLVGLVACGGKSSRMGSDKSLLDYNGLPQRYYILRNISPFCEESFLSLNNTQTVNENYPSITDAEDYKNSGPIAALLTAWKCFPGKQLLLIGCDYPLLDFNDVGNFLQLYKNTRRSAAFYNNEEGLYEPVLGLYHPVEKNILEEQFKEGNYSLQYFLRTVDAGRFCPADPQSIKSIDTLTDFELLKTTSKYL